METCSIASCHRPLAPQSRRLCEVHLARETLAGRKRRARRTRRAVEVARSGPQPLTVGQALVLSRLIDALAECRPQPQLAELGAGASLPAVADTLRALVTKGYLIRVPERARRGVPGRPGALYVPVRSPGGVPLRLAWSAPALELDSLRQAERASAADAFVALFWAAMREVAARTIGPQELADITGRVRDLVAAGVNVDDPAELAAAAARAANPPRRAA